MLLKKGGILIKEQRREIKLGKKIFDLTSEYFVSRLELERLQMQEDEELIHGASDLESNTLYIRSKKMFDIMCEMSEKFVKMLKLERQRKENKCLTMSTEFSRYYESSEKDKIVSKLRNYYRY